MRILNTILFCFETLMNATTPIAFVKKSPVMMDEHSTIPCSFGWSGIFVTSGSTNVRLLLFVAFSSDEL